VTTQTEMVAGTRAVPRVNLMPPEIAEAEHFRKLQLAMGAAVLASVVIVGGLYMHSKNGISNAQADLASAQSQNTALQSKLTSLNSVKATYAAVQTKRQLLDQAMGQEIRWSYVLNDLSMEMPSNVWLTGIVASESSAPGIGSSTTASASTTLPGAPTNAIGSIQFSGEALSHDDVAAWLDTLAKEKGLTDPTFSSSTEDAIGTRSVVDWGSSAQVDTDALSNRYIQKAGS
jgi:Tfp pilus assembly protein PilN